MTTHDFLMIVGGALVVLAAVGHVAEGWAARRRREWRPGDRPEWRA